MHLRFYFLYDNTDLYFVNLQPHSPDNRALARECKDVKIDRVYIGSCTGGKTEDFMAAAKLFLAAVRSVVEYCFSISIVCILNNQTVLRLHRKLKV